MTACRFENHYKNQPDKIIDPEARSNIARITINPDSQSQILQED